MRGILAALMIATAVPAFAQSPADTTILFSQGDWSVELAYDSSDDSMWCSADSENGDSQLFSVVMYDNGRAALLVFDPKWALRERIVNFLIDIDYSRWEMTGSALGNGIIVPMVNATETVEFLEQLSAGTALAVYNMDKDRLATFSLDGSSAALVSLVECWKRIRADRTDPFDGDGADPFGSSADMSDPF